MFKSATAFPTGRREFVTLPRACLIKQTRLACRASGPVEEKQSSSNSQEKPPANPQRLRIQKVEELGPDSWSGIAGVDREGSNINTSTSKAIALAGGDLLAIAIFAAIGRGSHGRSLDAASVLTTAAPFLIGWYAAAGLLKGFGGEAQGGSVSAAAKKAAFVWAVGIPVGVFIRSAQQGSVPNKGFVIVSLVTNFVFLVGWRSALAAVTPNEAGDGKSKASKRGNPLEFLQLLASLTNRW